MDLGRRLIFFLRMTVSILLTVYVLLLLINNSGQSASVWYRPFWPAEQMSIVALASLCFLSGAILGVVGYATVVGVIQYRRGRELRHRLQIAEMSRKASMLRVKPPASTKAHVPQTVVISAPPQAASTFEPAVTGVMATSSQVLGASSHVASGPVVGSAVVSASSSPDSTSAADETSTLPRSANVVTATTQQQIPPAVAPIVEEGPGESSKVITTTPPADVSGGPENLTPPSVPSGKNSAGGLPAAIPADS